MKSKLAMNVVITIPAYNEEKTLPRLLNEIKEVMRGAPYRWQVLVADDGSTDQTARLAKENGALVVSHRRNRGLAETFRTEMKECLRLEADVIVHTDADGQYHSQHIPELIQKVEQGYDLVLGSRFRGRIEQMPVIKWTGNKAFSVVISSLTKVRITDSTTGFRAFTAAVAREINYINTFTYTQEQIIKAAKQGFRITEIPIQARRTRKSRLFGSPWEYALKAWINIFRIYRDYNPLGFFGRVGLGFFFIGFVIGAWLVYLFITTGKIGHVPATIFSMLMMVIGVQIVLFGFLADMMHNK